MLTVDQSIKVQAMKDDIAKGTPWEQADKYIAELKAQLSTQTLRITDLEAQLVQAHMDIDKYRGLCGLSPPEQEVSE